LSTPPDREMHYYGDFYKLKGQGCRSTLEIVDFCVPDANIDKLMWCQPNIVVVMMNPGSSCPLDPKYVENNRTPAEIGPSAKLTSTRPDNVQDTIVKLMRRKRLRHARVLNLSDIRQARNFPEEYANGNLPDGHSIFCKARRAELETRLRGKPDVIAAWSYHTELGPLTRIAYDTIVSLGVRVHGCEVRFGFQYPRPNGRYAQQGETKWLKDMCAALA